MCNNLLVLLNACTILYLSESPAQALTFHSNLQTYLPYFIQTGTASLKTIKHLQTSNAHLLLQQGVNLYNAQKFSEAIQAFSQAVSAFQNQGDNLNLALTWRYISLAYQHLGQLQQGEQAITQSLTLLNQQNLNRNQAFLDVLAKTLNTQARLQFIKGQYSQAIETWKKTATIYKKSGNNTALIGILINQAEALQSSGLSSRAETELQHVEQILYQLQDHELKVNGLLSLGKTYRRVGNLGKSQAVLLKGLAMLRDLSLTSAKASLLLELGNTEQALAKQVISIGQQEQVEQHIQNAIKHYYQAAKYPVLQLEAQLNLLSLLVDIGNFDEAVKLLASIEPLLTSLPPSQAGIYAQLNFVQSLTKLERKLETGVNKPDFSRDVEKGTWFAVVCRESFP